MDDRTGSSALDRVHRDLAAGCRWKARDRLLGLVRARPGDPEILDLLGQVLYDMGDLPAAGRYWYLTDRDDDAAEAARAAFATRWGDDASQARQLPLYAPLSSYPAAVRERIAHLVPSLPRRSGRVVEGAPGDRSPRWRVVAVGVTTLVLTVGVWVVGIVALVITAARCGG